MLISLIKKIKQIFVRWLGKKKSEPFIQVYRAYGTARDLYIFGHVLEDKGLSESSPKDSILKNILSMIKRFRNHVFPEVKLEIRIEGHCFPIKTDVKGFFQLKIPNPGLDTGWHEGWVNWVDDAYYVDTAPEDAFSLLIPEPSASAVVSDVDDTFLLSYATQKLKKLYVLLFKNAYTRKSVEGIVPFYQSLEQGNELGVARPFFYVSSSEWNLYDFIVDFCENQGLPTGIFLLQDLKISLSDLWKSGGGSHQHKLEKIRHLFEIYPDMHFILIGDSGQKDPEFYYQIAQDYPKQVEAIYIRNVQKRVSPRLREIAEALRERDIHFLIFQDSQEAQQHAAQRGYVEMNV